MTRYRPDEPMPWLTHVGPTRQGDAESTMDLVDGEYRYSRSETYDGVYNAFAERPGGPRPAQTRRRGHIVYDGPVYDGSADYGPRREPTPREDVIAILLGVGLRDHTIDLRHVAPLAYTPWVHTVLGLRRIDTRIGLWCSNGLGAGEAIDFTPVGQSLGARLAAVRVPWLEIVRQTDDEFTRQRRRARREWGARTASAMVEEVARWFGVERTRMESLERDLAARLAADELADEQEIRERRRAALRAAAGAPGAETVIGVDPAGGGSITYAVRVGGVVTAVGRIDAAQAHADLRNRRAVLDRLLRQQR